MSKIIDREFYITVNSMLVSLQCDLERGFNSITDEEQIARLALMDNTIDQLVDTMGCR